MLCCSFPDCVIARSGNSVYFFRCWAPTATTGKSSTANARTTTCLLPNKHPFSFFFYSNGKAQPARCRSQRNMADTEHAVIANALSFWTTVTFRHIIERLLLSKTSQPDQRPTSRMAHRMQVYYVRHVKQNNDATNGNGKHREVQPSTKNGRKRRERSADSRSTKYGHNSVTARSQHTIHGKILTWWRVVRSYLIVAGASWLGSHIYSTKYTRTGHPQHFVFGIHVSCPHRHRARPRYSQDRKHARYGGMCRHTDETMTGSLF